MILHQLRNALPAGITLPVLGEDDQQRIVTVLVEAVENDIPVGVCAFRAYVIVYYAAFSRPQSATVLPFSTALKRPRKRSPAPRQAASCSSVIPEASSVSIR